MLSVLPLSCVWKTGGGGTFVPFPVPVGSCGLRTGRGVFMAICPAPRLFIIFLFLAVPVFVG